MAQVARKKAWSGSFTAAPLVTPLNQGIPFGRLSVVRGSPRRCAHAAMAGDVMSTNQGGTKPESNRGRQHLPAGLSQVNLNAAGIDVGASSHFVAVPVDRAERSVREFEAFTADLYRLQTGWPCGVESVVMESTGVYWIPLFGVLEERGFEVMLVDPRRIKNVPGRKTDVLDCQWLQQLHTYGLLSGAFRPDGEIRRLRSYLRQRSMLVRCAAQPHPAHAEGIDPDERETASRDQRDITGKTAWTSSKPSWPASGTRGNWRSFATTGSVLMRRPSPGRCRATARGTHFRAVASLGVVPSLSKQDLPTATM